MIMRILCYFQKVILISLEYKNQWNLFYFSYFVVIYASVATSQECVTSTSTTDSLEYVSTDYCLVGG